MKHVFRSLWFEPPISPYEKLCIQSFLDHGHAYHLYSYSDALDVPDGAVLRDAAEILPKSSCFAYREGFGAGSRSGGSNLFRYHLLRIGGWWVDTDVLCLSGDIPKFRTFFAFEGDHYINGAVLRFTPLDPLIEQCFAEAASIGADAIWGQIGPKLITRVAQEMNRTADASAPSTCYPIAYEDATMLLRPEDTAKVQEAASGSYFIHLWNEILRQADVDKYVLPPEGSFLRHLAERHPVSGWR